MTFRASFKSAYASMGVLLLSLASAGCGDLLSVDNPSSILEEDLNTEAGVAAVSAGLAGDFNEAFTSTAFWVALLSDELLHAGTAPSYRNASLGEVGDNAGSYNDLASARWVADDAVRRFGEVLDDASQRAETSEAHIYGGFALLLLADNFCQIPLDGGAPQTPSAIYGEAEQRFNEAVTVATAAGEAELLQRAYAGRARARLMLDDYAGAAEDAQRVNDGFVFVSIHSETPGSQNNEFPYQTIADIRREISVHPRIYNDTRFQSDPRVPFVNRGAEFIGTDGSTQFVEQRKYIDRSADMEIASWQEARLIEAEAAARTTDLGGAVDLIDEVRVAAGLDPYAGPVTEAAILDQIAYERTAELFLEGQRLSDMRRFADSWLDGRDTCYPLSQDERDANPNVP